MKVGKKGEIFTDKELRKKANIKEGGRVRATVAEGKLIIEAAPSIEDLIRNPVVRIRVDKAERLSEKAQKEEGIYGTASA